MMDLELSDAFHSKLSIKELCELLQCGNAKASFARRGLYRIVSRIDSAKKMAKTDQDLLNRLDLIIQDWRNYQILVEFELVHAEIIRTETKSRIDNKVTREYYESSKQIRKQYRKEHAMRQDR